MSDILRPPHNCGGHTIFCVSSQRPCRSRDLQPSSDREEAACFCNLPRNIWDKDFITSRREFVELRDGPGGFVKWATDEHAASKQVSTIRAILNDYETIAIGISCDILDEQILFTLFRTALLKDWDSAESFVTEMRNHDRDKAGNPAPYYIAFQDMADRWRKIQQGKFPVPWYDKILSGKWD